MKTARLIKPRTVDGNDDYAVPTDCHRLRKQKSPSAGRPAFANRFNVSASQLERLR